MKAIMAICFFTFLSGDYLSAQHPHGETQDRQGDSFNKTKAASISRTGSFELDMTPDQALPLFTAPGETLWVPHWQPVILKGDGFQKGTIWITSHGHQKTHWMVLDYDTEAHRAHYSRVTPDLNMGTVEVILKPNGSGGTRVHVSYELTALSHMGNKGLKKHFSETQYAEMMEDWRNLINKNRKKIDAHLSPN